LELSEDGWASSSHRARNQGNDEKDEEDDEENLRNAGKRTGNTAKTKETSDQRKNQERQNPTKHCPSPIQKSVISWQGNESMNARFASLDGRVRSQRAVPAGPFFRAEALDRTRHR